MLIFEIVDSFTYDFGVFTSQMKTQYGLHAFHVWLNTLGDINLNSLIVPKSDQRTGLGTAAMNALCRFADKHHKRIVLSPAQKDDYWGTTSRSRLVRFYKRFGFVENKGRKKDFRISDGMYRDPN